MGATNTSGRFECPQLILNHGGIYHRSGGFSQFGRQATNPQYTDPYLINPKVNYSTLSTESHTLSLAYEYGWLTQRSPIFILNIGSDTYNGQYAALGCTDLEMPH